MDNVVVLFCQNLLFKVADHSFEHYDAFFSLLQKGEK